MLIKRPELLAKLNSLLNRYGSDENFVAHMNEWPRTITKLVLNSETLMIRFGLASLLDDDEFIGME